MKYDNILGKIGKCNSNDDIKKFVEDNFKKIGVEKYTYHQMNIFIKLFISQFKKFESKVKFLRMEKEEKSQKEEEKDSIEEHIEEFVNYTKYFINGGFTKFLTEFNNNTVY